QAREVQRQSTVTREVTQLVVHFEDTGHLVTRQQADHHRGEHQDDAQAPPDSRQQHAGGLTATPQGTAVPIRSALGGGVKETSASSTGTLRWLDRKSSCTVWPSLSFSTMRRSSLPEPLKARRASRKSASPRFGT